MGTSLFVSGQSLGERHDALQGPTTAEVDRRAIDLLEPALAQAGDDPDAWQALGRSLWRLGRRAESFAAIQMGLRAAPGHEALLVDTATRASQLKRNDLALSSTRQMIAINPWRADYHHLAALVFTEDQAWSQAIDACRASIRLNAHDVEIRLLLVQALFRAGDLQSAHTEFDLALQYDPFHADLLRRWYAQLESSPRRRRPSGPSLRAK
jgi:tetratricopeptide (TPR) repeat protein